jgi:hypothetical protein
MKAADYMEAALKHDIHYCEKKLAAHPRIAVKRGRLVKYNDDERAVYERQLASAWARYEGWLKEKGL